MVHLWYLYFKDRRDQQRSVLSYMLHVFNDEEASRYPVVERKLGRAAQPKQLYSFATSSGECSSKYIFGIPLRPTMLLSMDPRLPAQPFRHQQCNAFHIIYSVRKCYRQTSYPLYASSPFPEPSSHKPQPVA